MQVVGNEGDGDGSGDCDDEGDAVGDAVDYPSSAARPFGMHLDR